MKLETLFLKITILLIGIPVLALCIFGLPWLADHPVNPNYAYILYPIVIGLYVSVIPFLTALYQSLRLLNYIDRNEAFSELSVKALKNIKYCAILISSLYAVMMPFVYLAAEKDDAPGLIIIGMIPIFASVVIAVFATVLQKLFIKVIEIKAQRTAGELK